ncbi:hypothetical protein IDH44_26040 [Paenibacillus sp. IB182496]|uniref:YfjL-like N-terminal domain-containing protein n=1 Tax=Paenibacillus sabuli TaxID=2772509 RepID=A0A927BZB2_9BACL|nr:hypothetical protein [Paenibacillus sabuli]MBD2848646.1 hypothetical protein [Paenibacillus sabuli]
MKVLRKIKKALPLLIFLSILWGILYFFIGNPIKYYTLKNEFRSYLEETYDQEFTVGRITFDMMHRSYHSSATDSEGVDFYVGQDNKTKQIEDAYEYELERLKNGER